MTAGSGRAASPPIAVQPASGLLETNEPVTFSILATGSSLTYQWLSNGIPISGANGDSLILNNVPSPPFAAYSVIISNASGVTMSAPTTIWPDSNGNGLPDWWEMQYFGNLNQTGEGDYDGDGVSNMDEFKEGTNPADSTSFNPRLHIQNVQRGRIFASPDQAYYTNGQIVTLTAIPNDGEAFVAWGGSAKGIKPALSLLMDGHKTVSANFGVPLPIALNNTNLAWTTSTNSPWFGQTDVSFDGISAAQNGVITNGQPSWLQTVTTNLSQPAGLTFWWKVSSQPPNSLVFTIDGVTNASISGENAPWQNVVVILPPGNHTLQWAYSDASGPGITGIPFQDSAWVDQVSIIASEYLVRIIGQPQGQAVLPGTDVLFNVAATGYPPLSYQWVFNGGTLSGATSSNLFLKNIQPIQSGAYHAIVSNQYISATSSVAELRVDLCVSPPPGLVAWWRYEETNALVAADHITGTQAVLVTNGIVISPGTPVGTTMVAGKVGLARRLGVGEFLTADGGGALNFATNQITIETWLKMENNATNTQMFTAQVGKLTYPDKQAYQILFESGQHVGLPTNQWLFEYILTRQDGTRTHNQNTGVVLPVDGLYHHVAMTYDGTTVRLYIDGVIQGSFVFTGNLIAVPSEPFAIGGAASFSIDETAVYNRALSSNEIAEINVADIAGKCISQAAPNFTSISLDGSNLILRGSGGTPTATYYVLATTNFFTPLTNWTLINTNAFDTFGDFDVTNLLIPGAAEQFFKLKVH